MVLFEPQWGSSVASTPWPPQLLRAYVTEAKRRGLAVICDEVMCGLGRHGQDARGATGCFLTECWDLRPDAVTFGKSIGGGAGHLLSGAILLTGASQLAQSSRTALQSHTYAGSSARSSARSSRTCGSTLLRPPVVLSRLVETMRKCVFFVVGWLI